MIVGAGPAGLAAAIRLQGAPPRGRRYLGRRRRKGLRGRRAHLSGAVVDPIGLDRLARLARPAAAENGVTKDQFLYLGPAGGVRLPNMLMPQLMNNHGNYIGSLGNVAASSAQGGGARGRNLSRLPGGRISRGGGSSASPPATWASAGTASPRPTTPAAWNCAAKYTSSPRGARLADKSSSRRFELDKDRDHQKYGLGVKEIWQVVRRSIQPGLVQHTMGWPLANDTGGGSWLYHFDDNLVSVGFVVHLNYKNPTLSPFDELQRFKTHPMIRDVFEGAKRIGYGARAIIEGGWQSVPKLDIPRRLPRRHSAGFVNVPRIKGSHNAMLSGMLGADHVFAAIEAGRRSDEVVGLRARVALLSHRARPQAVRNVKPLWSRFGTALGVGLGGLDMWMNQLVGCVLVRHHETRQGGLRDPQTGRRGQAHPLSQPDGVLTFDRLSSVFLSNTNHEEDQPIHLKVKDMELQKAPSTTSTAALRSITARPASTSGSRTGRAAFPDQRAELRPL